MNTGVGSLSLLQWIFLTQESILFHNICKVFYKQVILFQINRQKLVLQAFAQIIPFLKPLYEINGSFLNLLHMRMSAILKKCYFWWVMWNCISRLLFTDERVGRSYILKQMPWVACHCRRCKRTRIRSLSGEDPLEEGMATHSSILAWRIPWTEEPGGLQAMGSKRVGHDWSDLAQAHNLSWSLDCLLDGYFILKPTLKRMSPYILGVCLYIMRYCCLLYLLHRSIRSIHWIKMGERVLR